MAFLQIPIVPAVIDQEVVVELERVTYIFRFKWNFRASRWTMDISDDLGNLLLGGVPLVVSWPLLSRFKSPLLPKGHFFLFDSTKTQSEPGEESLGLTHFLLYRESTT
jgi:hypothetical protein